MSKPEATTEPKASALPDSLLTALATPPNASAQKKQSGMTVSKEDLDDLELFQAASNFLAASMIFLTYAPIAQGCEGLTQDDIKSRLLGHWGTCPGLVAVQAHLNLLIKQTNQDMLFVTGPGHGAPGVLAPLYLEGTITRFYGQYGLDRKGLDAFTKSFSWPGGFPSHVNAETPGAIHEGGELGYALAVAYGSVMDNPDLITCAVIGDGEAETGPTATAWHAHKFIDPAESGAVLPILHANGFKISERTLFGTMDDKEALTLFSGYGYAVCFVNYQNLSDPSREHDIKFQEDLYQAIHWAYGEIKAIQNDARSGKPRDKPRWPMIFMRSPKGWTGPRQLKGVPLVNSFRSHQVPLPAAKTDNQEFGMLRDWLASYQPETCFDSSTNASAVIRPEVLKILPEPSKRLGQSPYAHHPAFVLDLPQKWTDLGKAVGDKVSPMKGIGRYLDEVVKRNQKTFRIFSPDELRSNKLDSVLDLTTRNMQWDPETAHRGGRVIEMLSEHTLQGFVQGYALTGRYSIFPSYEAFLAIVDTMILQTAKFLKVALETRWRKDMPSLTYIETSTWTRQEHNGYSHQAPGLIDTLLTLPAHVTRIYLPPDSNCAISCIDHCLRSKNYVNLIVGSKNPGPNFLSPEQALEHCTAGASIWRDYSTDEGKDPDVVLVGIGVETMVEVIMAMRLLKEKAPEIRVRVINVVDLLVLAEPGAHPHALDSTAFDSLFTPDKPVVVNFHGYPSAVRSLLFGRKSHLKRSRFWIGGYREQGTTTTPFSILRLNEVGRFDVCIKALKAVGESDLKKIDTKLHELVAHFQHENRIAEKYALEHAKDPDWFHGGDVLLEQ